MAIIIADITIMSCTAAAITITGTMVITIMSIGVAKAAPGDRRIVAWPFAGGFYSPIAGWRI
jgi:hypothetical protein